MTGQYRIKTDHLTFSQFIKTAVIKIGGAAVRSLDFRS